MGSSPRIFPRALRRSQAVHRPWGSEDKLEQNCRLCRSRDNGVWEGFINKLTLRRRCGQVRRYLVKASRTITITPTFISDSTAARTAAEHVYVAHSDNVRDSK